MDCLARELQHRGRAVDSDDMPVMRKARNTYRHIRRSAAQIDDFPQMVRVLGREMVRVPLVGVGEIRPGVGVSLRLAVHDFRLEYPIHPRAPAKKRGADYATAS